MLLVASAFAASAEAKSKGGASESTAAGGSEAPTSSTGPSGTTGTTGTTGATTTTPTPKFAPIVLGPNQSPTAVYTGPVYELTSAGIVPYSATTSQTQSVDGGTTAAVSNNTPSLPDLLVPGNTAEEIQVNGRGLAAAPEGAPRVVQEVIWTANKIIGRPYVYGGGHKSFKSWGYDCSATVSYALHGGGLLKAPLDSGQFESWGAPGQGQWMTILTNSGHAYLDVAGLRLDTSPENDPSGLNGPRWRPLRPYNTYFVKRHPFGY
ncbi:MAG: hypothetical protein ABSG64_01660 [Solirubrobacteraceae bacterium]|jgi:cell wall-associated NlpC family hydrolase